MSASMFSKMNLVLSLTAMTCLAAGAQNASAQDLAAAPTNSAVSAKTGKISSGAATRLTFFGGAAKQICTQVGVIAPTATLVTKAGVTCGLDNLGVVTASLGAKDSGEALVGGESPSNEGAVTSRYAAAHVSAIGVGVKARSKVRVISLESASADDVVSRSCAALGLELVSSTSSSAPVSRNGYSCRRSANGKEVILEFTMSRAGVIN